MAHITPASTDNNDNPYFDGLEEDDVNNAVLPNEPIESEVLDPSAVLPECVPLALPSRGTPLGSVAILVEQQECIRQAEKHLGSL